MEENSDLFWNMHRNDGVWVDDVSTQVKELIWMMLQRHPELRATLNEVRASEWMTQGVKASLEEMKEELAKRKEQIRMDKAE
jgi:hypothetical protein